MNQTADDRWATVESRRKEADGKFFYGVLTTGVYCKPSCKSRLPLRKNVVFFETYEQAELAGLRPCKRCNPRHDEPAVMEQLARWIADHSEEPLTLEQLGEQAQLSPGHLQKQFKRAFGITPKQFHQACRAQAFRESIQTGSSITEAIFAAGFGSTSRFYESSNKRLGMTPKALAAKGQGESIRYAILPTPLGLLLVASTERGICFLQFGDAEEQMILSITTEFPAAEVLPMSTEQQPELARWEKALNEYLTNKVQALTLPMDVRGTAFQQLVWNYLQSIPRGEVRSYGEVAAALGQPGASRAVGRACATNDIALLIPCHRVIRGDGSLSNYRWGVHIKKALLELEQS